MSRQYADYEYSVDGHTVRVEKNDIGKWIWRVFVKNGDIYSSNDIGELYNTKRDAKAEAISFVKIKGWENQDAAN